MLEFRLTLLPIVTFEVLLYNVGLVVEYVIPTTKTIRKTIEINLICRIKKA